MNSKITSLYSSISSLCFCIAISLVVTLGIVGATAFGMGRLQNAIAIVQNSQAVVAIRQATTNGGSMQFLKKFAFASADYTIGTGELSWQPMGTDIVQTALAFANCTVQEVSFEDQTMMVHFTTKNLEQAQRVTEKLGLGSKQVDLIYPLEENTTTFIVVCK